MRKAQACGRAGEQCVRGGLLAGEDPEVLVLTAHALNAVERQHSRVSRQTRPHCRTRVLLRPRQNACKAGPVGLLAQIGGERLAAGDDQPVRVLLWRLVPKLLNAEVKAAHAALAGGLPLHLGQGVERDVDRHVPRGLIEQREKLRSRLHQQALPREHAAQQPHSPLIVRLDLQNLFVEPDGLGKKAFRGEMVRA